MLRNAGAADAFCNSEYFQVITPLATSRYSRYVFSRAISISSFVILWSALSTSFLPQPLPLRQPSLAALARTFPSPLSLFNLRKRIFAPAPPTESGTSQRMQTVHPPTTPRFHIFRSALSARWREYNFSWPSHSRCAAFVAAGPRNRRRSIDFDDVEKRIVLRLFASIR